jgi:hypothetical protein
MQLVCKGHKRREIEKSGPMCRKLMCARVHNISGSLPLIGIENVHCTARSSNSLGCLAFAELQRYGFSKLKLNPTPLTLILYLNQSFQSWKLLTHDGWR